MIFFQKLLDQEMAPLSLIGNKSVRYCPEWRKKDNVMDKFLLFSGCKEIWSEIN